MHSVSIFWFRRDLRIMDNHGLWAALQGDLPVLPIFIFDPMILNRLENKRDGRVEFIHQSISDLKSVIQKQVGDLCVFHSNPLDAFKELQGKFSIHAIYTNHDYEKYGCDRDNNIEAWAVSNQIQFHSYKDQVVFEKNEVLSGQGTPYTESTLVSSMPLKQLFNLVAKHFLSTGIKLEKLK